MLLNGTNVNGQDSLESQVCLSISQQIFYHAKSKSSSNNSTHRHSTKRKPPLPLYIALNVHTSTRSKKSVDSLHNVAVRVTYPHLDNAVCCRYCEENIICPVNLRKELFMIEAFDNLDHNPSLATSSGSFHGTCTSIFQFPQLDDNGTYRAPLTFVNLPESPNYSLPDSYAIVPVADCNISMVIVPSVKMAEKNSNLDDLKKLQYDWIQAATQLLQQEEFKMAILFTCQHIMLLWHPQLLIHQ